MKKNLGKIIFTIFFLSSIWACEEEFIIPTNTSLPLKSNLSTNPPGPPPSPYEGIWRLGSSNFRIKLPAPPNTAATYCEGGNSYPGTINWLNLSATFQYQDGNCLSNIYITFSSDGQVFTSANYEAFRTPQCPLPTLSQTYIPLKVSSGCN